MVCVEGDGSRQSLFWLILSLSLSLVLSMLNVAPWGRTLSCGGCIQYLHGREFVQNPHSERTGYTCNVE